MLNVSDERESNLRRTVNKEIIQSLEYPLMTSRYENVVEAYQKTFQWVLGESTLRSYLGATSLIGLKKETGFIGLVEKQDLESQP